MGVYKGPVGCLGKYRRGVLYCVDIERGVLVYLFLISPFQKKEKNKKRGIADEDGGG